MCPVFIEALFTIARTWKQPKRPSTDEWIKYGADTQWNITQPWKGTWLVIWIDMDGPRVYHTEWSKSERKKQIPYINAYMWNLEKWYRWTYLQGRNRDPDTENQCVDPRQWGRGRVSDEMDTNLMFAQRNIFKRLSLVWVIILHPGEWRFSNLKPY